MISPATADFVRRGLAQAQAERARLVVLQLDTPGGLDTSMRAIIKDVLASDVAVATFVAPEGARAASAGTYILYASHIAAMAPATNLGAATPVAIGAPGGAPGTPPRKPAPVDKERQGSGAPTKSQDDEAGPADAMTAKAVNDAAAYIRSLAQLRGRNAEFAETAVRKASSLSADDALAGGVIDVIAVDIPQLLTKIDGREVQLLHGKVKLDLAGAQIRSVEPDWQSKVLTLLSNPTVALLLLTIGIYGLFVEFTSPGFGVPGVAGAIALLLGLYALHLLPVNWVGVGLLLFGAALMIAEVFMPSFGVLGVGGIVAFVFGGLMLIEPGVPGYGISRDAVIVRILREYERGVVFQLGRFWKVKGPGLVIVVPGIQQMVQGRPARGDDGRAAAGRDLARQRLGQGQRGGLLPRRRSAEGHHPGRELPDGDQPAGADDAARGARQARARRDAGRARAAQPRRAAHPRRADRRLGHQGHQRRDQAHRPERVDGARDRAPGRGRARAARQGDPRRRREAGVGVAARGGADAAARSAAARRCSCATCRR
jgi:membrane-bound serine protease (ClpP class)